MIGQAALATFVASHALNGFYSALFETEDHRQVVMGPLDTPQHLFADLSFADPRETIHVAIYLSRPQRSDGTCELPPLEALEDLENLMRCFPEPQCVWRTTLDISSWPEHRLQVQQPKCTNTAQGTWVDINNPRALFSGSSKELSITSDLNRERGFHHIFVPNTCQYHLFNVSDLQTCLAGRSIGLIGDSVLEHTAASIKRWSDGKIMVDVLHAPRLRTGLKDIVSQETRLIKFMAKHDFIFVNHVLHDLSHWDSVSWRKRKQHHAHGGFSLEAANSAGTTSHRVANITGRLVALKYRPVFHFLERLETLFMIMSKHRRSTQMLYYIMDGQRAGYKMDCREDLHMKEAKPSVFANSPYVLQYIYRLAEPLCQAYNITVVDASKHKFSAKHSWFDDRVHFGRKADSGLQLFSNQVLYNVMCN
jgi:hypothetical protein